VLASPAAYAEEALQYKAQNLVAYKIHPPQSWREDIHVCEAVRKAVGIVNDHAADCFRRNA